MIAVRVQCSGSSGDQRLGSIIAAVLCRSCGEPGSTDLQPWALRRNPACPSTVGSGVDGAGNSISQPRVILDITAQSSGQQNTGLAVSALSLWVFFFSAYLSYLLDMILVIRFQTWEAAVMYYIMF